MSDPKPLDPETIEKIKADPKDLFVGDVFDGEEDEPHSPEEYDLAANFAAETRPKTPPKSAPD